MSRKKSTLILLLFSVMLSAGPVAAKVNVSGLSLGSVTMDSWSSGAVQTNGEVAARTVGSFQSVSGSVNESGVSVRMDTISQLSPDAEAPEYDEIWMIF